MLWLEAKMKWGFVTFGNEIFSGIGLNENRFWGLKDDVLGRLRTVSGIVGLRTVGLGAMGLLEDQDFHLCEESSLMKSAVPSSHI